MILYICALFKLNEAALEKGRVLIFSLKGFLIFFSSPRNPRSPFRPHPSQSSNQKKICFNKWVFSARSARISAFVEVVINFPYKMRIILHRRNVLTVSKIFFKCSKVSIEILTTFSVFYVSNCEIFNWMRRSLTKYDVCIICSAMLFFSDQTNLINCKSKLSTSSV